MEVSGQFANITATIAASGTKSGAVGFGSFSRGIFILPAAFTGTAMTFEVSTDGTNFFALNNDTGAISLTVAQGKGYALPAALAGASWFKFVSGSTEGSARTILLGLKY